MLRKDIEEKFPFLSVVTYGGQEYIGIINNQDSFITSMYIFTDILSEDLDGLDDTSLADTEKKEENIEVNEKNTSLTDEIK